MPGSIAAKQRIVCQTGASSLHLAADFKTG
jgi:hypothetical protein